MEPIVLQWRPEEWEAIPGTPYAVRVGTIRHRIAMRAGDEFARSMLTAVLTLREGKVERLSEHVEPGEAVDFRGLRLTLLQADDTSVELEVRPARPSTVDCGGAP